MDLSAYGCLELAYEFRKRLAAHGKFVAVVAACLAGE